MGKATYSYREDPSVPDFQDDKPLIVFDGHCVLCSRWANFVITQDKHKRFRMLAAQSELGEALYAHYGIKSDDYDTNILLEGGRIRIKSDGTIAMIAGLGFPWSAVQLFRIFPSSVRDWFYDRLARNRINWFGRQEQCFMPPAGQKDRFL